MKNLVTLSKFTGWYGSHSGYYEQLPKYLDSLIPQKLVRPRKGWIARALGKSIAYAYSYPPRDQSKTLAEFEFLNMVKRSGCVGLVAAAEDHLPMISRLGKKHGNIAATIHFPPTHWSEEKTRTLSRLSSAIILYSRDLEFFERIVGKERVRFVPHGVDTDFFVPDESIQSRDESFHVLVVGQFDRDFRRIHKLLKILTERFSSLTIDVVIAEHGLRIDHAKSLVEFPNCVRHSGISDETLRYLYQRARLLFLPMIASGANNAFVEALACGTPIVTNDVGGIRDYGGGTVFPLATTDDELLDLASEYLCNDSLYKKQSIACRQFAEEQLRWDRSSELHLEALRSLQE